MTRIALFLSTLIILFAGSAFAHDATDLRLTCSSDGRYTECDAGITIYTPRVFRQLSVERRNGYGACEFGTGWGTEGTRFWTNHGCSAVFSFSATPPPEPPPVPVPTPCPQNLTCEWNGVNYQPYTHDYNYFVGITHFGFQSIYDCQETIEFAQPDIVCNWAGDGFHAYRVSTNEAIGFSYGSIQACYAHAR